MPLPIYRLRRWLLALGILFCATVAAMYFYARMRERNVLKEIPHKIGLDIKQTASGFQFSKSDGKRTLFTIEASDLKQFKLNGSAELHKVSIVLYGRDSSRFDQIYGDDFTYDKGSGNITARGDVQIDLEANPAGLAGRDQETPKELKNPIHLKTRDLVFNQGTGDAFTDARVDFGTQQANGWAIGIQYSAKSNTLTLTSQIHVTIEGANAARISATHGRITRDPRIIELDNPRMERSSGTLQADTAEFFLGPDNNVERVHATGNVAAESTELEADQMHARADEGEMILSGKQNILQTAMLAGNVHVARIGSQPMEGDAGRVDLDFGGRSSKGQSRLQKAHASEGVRLSQHAVIAEASAASASSQRSASSPQNYDITAPVIDFFLKEGRRLDRAQTSGAAQITISPASSAGSNTVASNINDDRSPVPQRPVSQRAVSQRPVPQRPGTQRTVITAGRFDAKFGISPEGASRLSSVHGAPDAKVVSMTPGLPDRVSTSRTLDADFLPRGGIATIIQQGKVAYTDGQSPEKRTQAWAEKAVYTPGNGVLVLTGNPRVADGGMVTTANTVRVNRVNDEAVAEGEVKSTYDELKEQPDGGLLASSSPIHVTAASMTAHNSTAIALYEGKARLWQDANVISAPSIQFDRNQRSLLAQGTAAQPVSTVLVQEAGKHRSQKTAVSGEKRAKIGGYGQAAEAITINSLRLVYADGERKAHYEGGVQATGTAFTATANTVDAYLLAGSQAPNNQQVTGRGRLDHMVAQGKVVIQQPDRRAEGEKLVYTAADDKFVLTGGPPSIFDAERGKITGVSLTFFQGDDRVLVEGEASTPVVTQTRVAR